MAVRTEELHSELVPYLGESEVLGAVLKAPLVYLVPYLPSLAAFANEMYRTKTEGIHRAEAEKTLRKIVWLHEKPYRLAAFRSVCDRLTDREYWEVLGSIWLETENLHEDQEAWLEALTADRPGRVDWLMDEDDRAVLASLDDEVTIYRGFIHPARRLAPSWSLSRAKAEWFATRTLGHGRQSYLATTTVPTHRVIAYFGGRGEQEIVLDPATLFEVQVTRVAALRRG